MRFADFRQHRLKPSDSVFAFVCEDDFLVDESRAVWKDKFEGNWITERIQVRDFDEIPFSQLMDDALTPSLFSQSRVILVGNAEKLRKDRIHELEKLQGIDRSSLKIVLVLSGIKAADGLSKAFPVVSIEPLKPADCAKWMMDRHGLSPDVARYLVENVGSDLHTLNNEIEKLQTFVGPGKPITPKAVDELILRSEQFGPFDIDDAIIARDYRKAVTVVGAMLDDGADPLIVLSRIVRVWRLLFIGKGVAVKQGPREVAAIAGVPSFKAGEFAAGCRKYEWKQIAAGFKQLLNLDRALKSSNPDVEAAFDVLLWKLTR